MMLTQKGKLLYISDNAAEYLGHSMVSETDQLSCTSTGLYGIRRSNLLSLLSSRLEFKLGQDDDEQLQQTSVGEAETIGLRHERHQSAHLSPTRQADRQTDRRAAGRPAGRPDGLSVN